MPEAQFHKLSLTQLPDFVAQNLSSKAGIYLLKGDLGSGKTTFVKHFLSFLGFSQAEISSPTYTICQEYRKEELSVQHLDLYRLKEKAELDSFNLQEILDQEKAITIIEWPELMGELKQPYTLVELDYTDDASSRLIRITKPTH